MYINGKVWKKIWKDISQNDKSDYQWEVVGIGYGNLGLTLMFYYLYRDKIFIDCVTKS